jgi:hypothetical protein
MTIWTKCAYAWNITGRSRYGRRHTHTVSKECRKMRTWLWLVGLKKVSKPSKGMTTCPLTKTCVGKMPASSSVRRTTSSTYLHLAEARFCSDLALLWYGRFSLRERFIKSRSRRPLYATCVRLDDQCVWARAIDVSWTPPAQAGRGVILVRAPPGGAARLGNQKATQWATGTATLKRYKNELGAALKPTSTQATQGNREATQTRKTKRSAEGRPEDADQATRAATGDHAGHPSRHTTTPELWTRSTGARQRPHRQPDRVSRQGEQDIIEQRQQRMGDRERTQVAAWATRRVTN